MTVLRWIVWSRFGLLLLSLPTLWVALALDWFRIGTGAYGANTLLVDSSPRLFTLTLLSCLTTSLAWKTLRVSWHYGPWRFDRQTPPDPLPDSPWWELALSSALGLSLPVAAWWYTTDTSPPEKQGAYAYYPLAVALGLASAVGAQYLLRAIDYVCRVDAAVVFVLSRAGLFSQGYITSQDGRQTAAGHTRLFTASVFAVLLYVALYLSVRKPEVAPFAAVFYGLAVLMAPLLVLAGLAFWLDRWQIPTLGTLVIVWLLLGLFIRVDHYYPIKPFDGPKGPEDWSIPAAIQRRKGPLPQTGADRGRTLVIVTAEGGGIQAAAWTASVLTRLHHRYGPDFTRSVAVISSVSGGSVGAMYYLNEWQKLCAQQPGDDASGPSAAIVANAKASSLESIFWGLAFYDAQRRFNPLSLAVLSRISDRGQALEDCWRRRLDHEGLAGWTIRNQMRTLIYDHNLPIPIFNSTLVETGQRFLLSPLYVNPDPRRRKPGNIAASEEFLRLYPGSDIDAVTAVRLSASFSYVSPMARPAVVRSGRATPLTQGWAADGGYTDYEGLSAALDVVSALSLYQAQREEQAWRGGPVANSLKPRFDRILLVRISAFPELEYESRPARMTEPAGPFTIQGGDGHPFVQEGADAWEPTREARHEADNYGAKLELFGPIGLLDRVRVAAQAERRERSLFQTQGDLADFLKAGGQRPARRSITSKVAQSDLRRRTTPLKEYGEKPPEAQAPSDETPENFVPLFAIQIRFPVPTGGGDGKGEEPEPEAIPINWRLTENQLKNVEDLARKVIDELDEKPVLPREFNDDPRGAWTFARLFPPVRR